MYREEIALGEKAVAALKRQQAAYEERVTVVATEWNALQAHVETLAARVTGGVDATNPNAAPAAPVEDPFLRRLVRAAGGDEAVVAKKRAREEREGAGRRRRVAERGDKPPAADAASASDSDDEDGAARDVGGLDEDATRAVDALRARAASVKSTLAKVLDAVDAANARQTGAAGRLRLARPRARARARVAALDARATADAEQLERFREQTTKQRKRNEELGKKLEDSTADVEMLRRQLPRAERRRPDRGPTADGHRAQRQGGGGRRGLRRGGRRQGRGERRERRRRRAGGRGGSRGARPPPPAAPPPAADAEALSKLQGLVYELEGRLKASTSHLDAASSKCAALEGEARGLRDQIASESAVTSSRPFAASARLRETARRESTRSGAAASDLQRDADALRADLRASAALASRATESERRAALAEARVGDAEARARAALSTGATAPSSSCAASARPPVSGDSRRSARL